MKGARIRDQQAGEFHFLTFSCYRRRDYLSPVAAMNRVTQIGMDSARKRMEISRVDARSVNLPGPQRQGTGGTLHVMKFSKESGPPAGQQIHDSYNVFDYLQSVDENGTSHSFPVEGGYPDDHPGAVCPYQYQVPSTLFAYDSSGAMGRWPAQKLIELHPFVISLCPVHRVFLFSIRRCFTHRCQ